MNDSEHSEESLFEQCLELPLEERVAFVESACAGNSELRDSVLRLLSSHDTVGGFMETSPEEDSGEVAERLHRIAPAEESPGDQIGRYHLLELIGEGAWGSVWMAQQTEDIERRVALKILKLGLNTKDFLARFEAERQMLAMMDHPNIARVLDAGATDFGRPYLVMELVRGMPLLDYADKNRLGISDRVKLCIKICQAMQHAHQKGIIHRDLKPSNILVTVQDNEAMPKVIDFGVAKTNQLHLTDKTLFTSIHTFIGTPVYSSPEQLEFSGMEVDPRSDVYSLGALLYEFLCGETPFDYDKLSKEGMEALRVQVREKSPPSPSLRFDGLSESIQVKIAAKRQCAAAKVVSHLKGDLDWVIMKCLEKEPNRRYDSAQALANDLQAFLDGKPVSAAAPSMVYRVRKFVTRKRPAYAVWLEVSLVVVVILAAYSFLRPHPGPPPVDFELTQTGNHSGEIIFSDKSIAVLPFVNMSTGDENEYLSDGLTEEILNALAKVPGLRVPARTSSFVFKGKTEDIKKIGQLLRVATVLEGSVQMSGNQLRVTAQLNKVSDGYQMWSEKYDREMTNIFEIQDEIALAIVSELELELAAAAELPGSKHHMDNVEAYTLYLRGKFLADKFTEPELRRAITFFERALKLQPDYALAHTGLAFAYGNLSYFGYVPPGTVLPQFRTAASKALELDDTLAEAHFSLAQLRFNFEWDWVGAEQAFKRALELDPANVWAHGLYAFLLSTMDRHEEAMVQATKARELDPLSVNATVNTGWMSFLAGDYNEALIAGRRGIEMDVTFANAHTLIGYTLFRRGEYARGIAAMETAHEIAYFPAQWGSLGRMYGLVGRKDEAQNVLNDLLTRSKEQYIPALSIAYVYDGLGDFEQANVWMNKAITNREGGLDLFKVDFVDVHTRANPYYSEWLKKIGLD